MDKAKFGTSEAMSLIIITITVKVCFTSPGVLARYVGNAGYITTCISSIVAMIAFWFIYLLLKRFPQKNLSEIFRLVFGKFLGALISIVMAAFLFITVCALLREFTEVIRIFVLETTNPSFIITSILVPIVLFSMLGLETIARFSRLLVFYLLVGISIMLILSYDEYNKGYLFPIFGYGLNNILLHGIRRSSFYYEVILVAIFAPALQGIKNIKKVGFLSILFSGIITAVCLLAFSMEFSYGRLQELSSPLYILSRNIKISEFFQRLEPIFLFVWCIGTIISASAVFYGFIFTYCEAFKIDNYKIILLNAAILLLSVAMIPDNIIQVTEGIVHLLREYGWVIAYVIPLITLIVAIITGKRSDVVT